MRVSGPLENRRIDSIGSQLRDITDSAARFTEDHMGWGRIGGPE
jgi:hypothetical protein